MADTKSHSIQVGQVGILALRYQVGLHRYFTARIEAVDDFGIRANLFHPQYMDKDDCNDAFFFPWQAVAFMQCDYIDRHTEDEDFIWPCEEIEQQRVDELNAHDHL